MARHITIDARLARTSGIGTYLQEVVPRVVARLTDLRFTLLGDPDVLGTLAPVSPRVVHRAVQAPIYSVAEQVALARAIPRDTSLFWAPHYNIPLLHRGPLAVTIHDVNHLVIPQSSWARRVYAREMFAAVRRRAAVVFCNSAFTAAELARTVGAVRSPTVTPLGVSARWFALPGDRPPVPAPYFLYVGNVKPHKNLPRLLEAFEQVSADVVHGLVIAGARDGLRSGDDRVARMAARIGPRVTLTGALSRADLERYVAGCQALVLPSLYEGFGLPPLEALAAGRPVGVARAGALPEVCGAEADYFDPLDVASIAAALRRLATRVDDAGAVARRRTWAARFDWDRCAELTADGLRRAASGATSQ